MRISAAVLGASWEPVGVVFDMGAVETSATAAPYSETVGSTDYQCDYDPENPIHDLDLDTLYADKDSYLYNEVGEDCPCTAVVANDAYFPDTAVWWAHLDDDHLITGIRVREDKANLGSETLDGWLFAYVVADDQVFECGALDPAPDAGVDGEIACAGAGIIGKEFYLIAPGDFDLCQVSVIGYPLPEPLTEELEAQLVVDRLYHKEDSEYYDILQTKYDTLSDYYNTVQERFVELSNLFNEVSLWKSEVDGDATLLQAVIDKYEARTVGENCVFGLAGFAWWCKEASPIAY